MAPTGNSSAETTGSPTFLGNPDVPLPCSSTPAGPTRQAVCGTSTRPPQPPRRRLTARISFGAQSHGFSTRCLRFAVPVTRPHARLASGRRPALPDGIDYPKGSNERFQTHVMSVILLSQAFVAQGGRDVLPRLTLPLQYLFSEERRGGGATRGFGRTTSLLVTSLSRLVRRGPYPQEPPVEEDPVHGDHDRRIQTVERRFKWQPKWLSQDASR